MACEDHMIAALQHQEILLSTSHDQGSIGAKRMAGNANTAEIEPAAERSLLPVHMLHLVNGKTEVAGPVEGILEIGRGALHRLQRLLTRAPHCLITP